MRVEIFTLIYELEGQLKQEIRQHLRANGHIRDLEELLHQAENPDDLPNEPELLVRIGAIFGGEHLEHHLAQHAEDIDDDESLFKPQSLLVLRVSNSLRIIGISAQTRIMGYLASEGLEKDGIPDVIDGPYRPRGNVQTNDLWIEIGALKACDILWQKVNGDRIFEHL